MFPVAFGLFETETEENWVWFMRQLRRSIGHMDPLAISTDACKGLTNAVKEVFPRAEGRECHAHMMLNLYSHYAGSVFRYMFPAARVYKPSSSDYFMSKIFAEAPELPEYLAIHHSQLWKRSQFNPDIKVDYINNNLAECLNNWVKDIKVRPVHILMDNIRGMIMKLLNIRREIGRRLRGHMLPPVVQQLHKRSRGLAHLKVLPSTSRSCEVVDMSKSGKRDVVNIQLRECTCLEWQHTGKPCDHALAFLVKKRTLPHLDQYLSDYYSMEKFRAAYAGSVEPCTDPSQWPQVQLSFELCQPVTKRGRGRPQVNRFKNFLEKKGSAFCATKKGKNRCKTCHLIGHRAAGCPLNAPKPRYEMVHSHKKLFIVCRYKVVIHVLFFYRKRKVRNKTADSVILLREENQNEWSDDAGQDSGADWPDFPRPGDAGYVKVRKLAPRKRKKAGDEEASGREGKRKKVGTQAEKEG